MPLASRNRRIGRSNTFPRLAAIAAAFWLASHSPPAQATPQWNVGVVPGIGLLGRGGSAFGSAVFWGALRGDLILARERSTDFGFGPYLMLGSAGFRDVRASAGASLLVPWNEDFPLVVSAGALTRDGRAFGLDSAIFWGIRSYNFHGSYNLSGGVILGAQRTFGSASDTAFTLGLQIDVFVLAIPFMLVRGALG